MEEKSETKPELLLQFPQLTADMFAKAVAREANAAVGTPMPTEQHAWGPCLTNYVNKVAAELHKGNEGLLERMPLGLHLVNGMRVVAQRELDLKETPQTTVDGFPALMPIGDALRPQEKAFWQSVNEVVKLLGSDTRTLNQKFQHAYHEYLDLMYIKVISAAYEEAKIPQEFIPAAIRQTNADVTRAGGYPASPHMLALETGRNKPTSKPLTQSSDPALFNKAALMRLDPQKFQDDYRVGIRDFYNAIYTPVMGSMAISPGAKDADAMSGAFHSISDTVLGEYASGLRKLNDLIDVSPSTAEYTFTKANYSSPQEAFLVCLQLALHEISREKGSLDLPLFDSKMHTLTDAYNAAVLPSQEERQASVELYDKYTRTRKKFDALLEKLKNVDPQYAADELKDLLGEYGLKDLSLLTLPPRAQGDAIKWVPDIMSKRARYAEVALEVLEKGIKFFEEDLVDIPMGKRLKALQDKVDDTTLPLETQVRIIDEVTTRFPQLKEGIDLYVHELNIKDVARVISEMYWELDKIPEVEQSLTFLVQRYEEEKAILDAARKAEENAVRCPFDPSFSKANQLSQTVRHLEAGSNGSSLNSAVLLPAWRGIAALHQASVNNAELKSFTTILFSDPSMLVLEYMVSATDKSVDPQALNKRFSNMRVQLPKTRKTLEEILEYAAIEKSDPGIEKRYLLLAETIFANPAILACVAGERTYADKVRTQIYGDVAADEETKAAIIREGLATIGVGAHAIDAFYPPPPPPLPPVLPTPQYITPQGRISLYTRSPRHIDLTRELDRVKVDTDMFLLGALEDNRTYFQSELLVGDKYILRLKFSDGGDNEKVSDIPINATHIDDAVDISMALQSYVLNKEGIEPLRKAITGGQVGVRMDHPMPYQAGNTTNSRVHVHAGNGQLFLAIDSYDRHANKPVKVSLPLGLADKPENRSEAEIRKHFVQEVLVEKFTQQQWITKRQVMHLLTESVNERKQSWVDPGERVMIDGYADPTPLAFPQEPSAQKSFISPASIWLQPGGNNPSYILNFSIHVNDGEKRGLGEAVRGKAMNLHTRNPALAMARARMALEQLQEGMLQFADTHPQAQWIFLPHHQRQAYKTRLISHSDEPMMTSRALEEVLDKITRYEDDIWVSPASSVQSEDGSTKVTFKVIRSMRQHALDQPYNRLLKQEAPTQTEEQLYTDTNEGQVVPMAMTLTIPAAMRDRVDAFIDAVKSSFSTSVGVHYSTAAIAVKEGERDTYTGSHDYREDTARKLFAAAVDSNVKEILESTPSAVITEPLPKNPRAGIRRKPPAEKRSQGWVNEGNDRDTPQQGMVM